MADMSFARTSAGQAPAAAIFGVEGLSLNAAEKEFFARVQPFGFILFARNCDNPAQVRALTDELRALTGRSALPILIDQEGGRVARLRPPHWRATPAAAALSAIAPQDLPTAKKGVFANARLMADELHALGITVDCAPLADVPVEGAHDIIGDRAFAHDPYLVSQLAAEQAQALMEGGVLPVLKHIPGHGRALADSHLDLPEVSEPLSVLEESDFVPFRALRNLPLGMTAHIVYHALDASAPATTSKVAIDYIRNVIGFEGLLMSDDLSMKALKGTMQELTSAVLDAGCDLVLHCNGKMDEMRAIAETLRPLDAAGLERAERAAYLLSAPKALDKAQAEADVAFALERGTTMVA
jgi:beta-N-acetylhexosaminidase